MLTEFSTYDRQVLLNTVIAKAKLLNVLSSKKIYNIVPCRERDTVALTLMNGAQKEREREREREREIVNYVVFVHELNREATKSE